jgi:hypothetical protein
MLYFAKFRERFVHCANTAFVPGGLPDIMPNALGLKIVQSLLMLLRDLAKFGQEGVN